jgi:hypothetical protein
LELELAGMDFVVEERLQLQETAREKRTRELDEAVAEKELEVLIQALLGCPNIYTGVVKEPDKLIYAPGVFKTLD